MRGPLLWLLPLLAGCAEPGDTGVAADALLEVGVVEGTLSRTAELVGDGLGHVMIALFVAPEVDEAPVMLSAFAAPSQDLRDPDWALPFRFTNVFPHSRAYGIAAIFDEDEDLFEDTADCAACDGDLATVALGVEPLDGVQVESGETTTVDLALRVVAARDWPMGSGGAGQARGPGVLAGTLSRTTSGDDDNRGDVYLMLFASDPRLGGEAPLYSTVLDDVDLSAAGAAVAYRVEGLPAEGEARYLVAFLDDNGTGAYPDTGDLMALEGVDLPRVFVDPGAPTELDIVFSMQLP